MFEVGDLGQTALEALEALEAAEQKLAVDEGLKASLTPLTPFGWPGLNHAKARPPQEAKVVATEHCHMTLMRDQGSCSWGTVPQPAQGTGAWVQDVLNQSACLAEIVASWAGHQRCRGIP